MRVDVEEYNGNWVRILLKVKKQDVEILIATLKDMIKNEETQKHFHLNYNDKHEKESNVSKAGFLDIEVGMADEDEKDNLQIPAYAINKDKSDK